MENFLKFVGIVLVMLAVVPLFGLLMFGSWKMALAYSKAWAKAIGWLLVAGVVISIVMYLFVNLTGIQPPP